MRFRALYIFTNRTYSKKSIMSTVFGVIAVVSLIIDIYLSYRAEGASVASYGVACLLAMIYAFVGIILGVMAKLEQDKYYFFAKLGIALNIFALALVSAILYAGILING